MQRRGQRLAVAAAAVLAPAVALAGAWTWPEGTGQAILSLTGGEGAYDGRSGPGAAHETRLASSLDLEYGLNHRVTAVVEGGFEDYAIAAPVADAYRGLDYSAAGLRARLLSSESFVWSAQATGLVPSARDPLRPAQAGNTGFDSDWRTLVGANFVAAGWPSFADAEFGYRTRAGGPPGEWRADLTLGARPRPDLTIMAQAFSAVSNGRIRPSSPPRRLSSSSRAWSSISTRRGRCRSASTPRCAPSTPTAKTASSSRCGGASSSSLLPSRLRQLLGGAPDLRVRVVSPTLHTARLSRLPRASATR